MILSKRNERGQSVVLVATALSLFLLGGLGFMIDASHMFAQRQMAQVAADAAAQAGISSIFEAVNTSTNTTAGACTSSDSRSACVYAQNNGFKLKNDTVTISFPSTVAGLTPSPDYSTPCVQAIVTRPVNTTFMGMLGASASTVLARGTACIVQTPSRTPILVLDKTDSNTFSLGGNPNVVICGGPSQSIQVDSNNSSSVNTNGSKATVDLSQGGPGTNNGTGNCSGVSNVGTGGIFGVNHSTGGSGIPSFLTPNGSTEAYNDVGYIGDPLADVSAPSKPTTNGTATAEAAGTGDCPAGSGGCTVYTPGYYANGIQVKNTTGIFNPGIYYLDGSTQNYGFSNAANGNIMMCSAHCTADTSGCCSSTGTPANGMLLYLSPNAGPVNITANSSAAMTGTNGSCTLADTNCFLGMLFFVSRSAATQSQSLGGGGNVTLTGTVYMPNQDLSLQGNSGSTTSVTGEIIVYQLSLGGGGTINMNLVSNYQSTVDQIALVQ